MVSRSRADLEGILADFEARHPGLLDRLRSINDQVIANWSLLGQLGQPLPSSGNASNWDPNQGTDDDNAIHGTIYMV